MTPFGYGISGAMLRFGYHVHRSYAPHGRGDFIPNEAIVNTVIPMTVKLKDTEIEHKPINILYPKEHIKKIYDSVISELKEKGVL